MSAPPDRPEASKEEPVSGGGPEGQPQDEGCEPEPAPESVTADSGMPESAAADFDTPEAADEPDVTGAGAPEEPAPALEASPVPVEGGESPAPEPVPVTAEAVRLAEALLFASDRPVQPARLQQVLPEGQQAQAVLIALGQVLEGRGVVLAEVAGGWALRTAPDLAPALTRVVEVPRRLPRVAMETLAVIAWHQPVTRAEIEEIRGAGLSQATLEALLENGLIAPKGHKEVPGRPTLWGTTTRFLEQFGLASIRDLPKREELVSAEAAAPLLSAAQEPSGEETEAPGDASQPEDEPPPAGSGS